MYAKKASSASSARRAASSVPATQHRDDDLRNSGEVTLFSLRASGQETTSLMMVVHLKHTMSAALGLAAWLRSRTALTTSAGPSGRYRIHG